MLELLSNINYPVTKYKLQHVNTQLIIWDLFVRGLIRREFYSYKKLHCIIRMMIAIVPLIDDMMTARHMITVYRL